MTSFHHLGELQFAIMRVLWARGEATVSEVREALPGEWSRALTTIATMLTKMERKGVVGHRAEGRQFVYQPLVSEREVRRSMVSALTQRLFEGDAAALVSHLIDEQEIEAEELAALRQRLALLEAERRAPARRDRNASRAPRKEER
jgi:predicted transcriptional regulator